MGKTCNKSTNLRFLAVLLAALIAAIGLNSYMSNSNAAKPKLSKTKLTLNVGGSKTLTLKNNKKKVKWSSSKKSVATVNSNGKVTAKKAGKATITAKVGSKKYKCKITVKAVKVKSVKLAGATTGKLPKGYKFKLYETVQVSPANATNKSVSYSSNNKKVATVSSKGVVTTKGYGTAKITVKAKDGSKKQAVYTVKVAGVYGPDGNGSTIITPSGKTDNTVYVNRIFISSYPDEMYVGDYFDLSEEISVSPANATNKKVSYASSNTSAATISSDGVIFARATGTVTITVAAKDGSGVKDYFEITVQKRESTSKTETPTTETPTTETEKKPETSTDEIYTISGGERVSDAITAYFYDYDIKNIELQMISGEDCIYEYINSNDGSYKVGFVFQAVRQGRVIISAKYQGKEIKRWIYNIESNYEPYLQYQALLASIINESCSSGMSNYEKLNAVKEHIFYMFDYGGTDGTYESWCNGNRLIQCIGAARIMTDAARKMGFTAKYFARGDNDIHDYLGYCTGHTFSIVYVDGKWIGFDACPTEVKGAPLSNILFDLDKKTAEFIDD